MIRRRNTRSGRLRWGGGLSPGLPGVCFSVCGYFVVVMFGVCAGQGVGLCLCVLCLCVVVVVC
uniref:Uncharacterized protein n=1 Tax=Siphoviridae sp. ctRGj11 TaxID=2827868 RepID=A0A8S5SL61_9CAUD|nr:MAG TPA: hypothetical protein [Siphoviridae sp. ctRGj11]